MEEKKWSYGECPVCGKGRQKPKHLVCRGCFQEYVSEASIILARENKAISLSEWVGNKIPARIKILEDNLVCVRGEYENLQKQVRADACSIIGNTPGIKKLRPEIIQKALAEKKKQLWDSKGGNNLHYRLKSTESKISSLNDLCEELAPKRPVSVSSYELLPSIN